MATGTSEQAGHSHTPNEQGQSVPRQYLGLGASKGTDQFELFAKALGATLPSMADSATEGVFSGLGGTSSTDGSFATGSDSGTTVKEERGFLR